MNIERLKFAHARGARIEGQIKTSPWKTPPEKDAWQCLRQPNWAPGWEYRIQPGYDILQYGPLSSACLELAKYTRKETDTGHRYTTPVEWAAREFAIVFAEDMIDPHGVMAADFEDFWDLWLGFVAEYLADLGM